MRYSSCTLFVLDWTLEQLRYALAGARLMAVARRYGHKGSYNAARAGFSAYYVPHVPEIARIRGPAILARST